MQKRIPKSVEITTSLGSEPIITRINSPLFSWVIENIMKNAADAMDGNGKLKISFNATPLSLHILIEDTGKGIPSSMHKTIFEPGYTTKDRGWGLGLSLAKRIIEGHHEGKIHVKSSKKDMGTVIELIIPILIEKK
jgi:signal transduction histidine kinase